MNEITIIIPTYNRAPLLALALEGYLRQSRPELIKELLVVDDGSTDSTCATVTELCRRSPFPIRYLRQDNKGPAAARNLGIREACSSTVLFSDSDIVPSGSLVREHVEWHEKYPAPEVAVLGYVTWPTHPCPTPFMKWYGEAGPLFAYRTFGAKRELSFLHFYSCNLSLKREFLLAHGQFDEEFRSAAYEDIELGYRLNKSGLRLCYNRNAIAYHHQFFFFFDACRKARNNAAAIRVFLRKEAGQHVLQPRIQRRSRLPFRFARWMAMRTVNMLMPFEQFLDSHLPLPDIVYRLFFWYHAIRPIDLSER